MAKPKTKAQNAVGRPTSLTADVEERIISAVKGGSYLDDAAAYAGISERTLFRWVQKGKEALNLQEMGIDVTDEEQRYGQFCQSLQRARSEASIRNLTLIQRAAQEGTWQAAAWYLERTNPKKWGRKDTFEIEGVDKDTPDPRADIAILLDERISRMRERSRAVIEVTGQPADVIDDETPKSLRIAK
jgi:hypothetical protein